MSNNKTTNAKLIESIIKMTACGSRSDLARYLSERFGVSVTRQQINQFSISNGTTVTHLLLRVVMEHKAMKELDLDSVLISPNTVKRWFQIVAEKASEIEGLAASQIPDEKLEELPGGELRLFVSLPGKPDVEMTIPAKEWRRVPLN